MGTFPWGPGSLCHLVCRGPCRARWASGLPLGSQSPGSLCKAAQDAGQKEPLLCVPCPFVQRQVWPASPSAPALTRAHERGAVATSFPQLREQFQRGWTGRCQGLSSGKRLSWDSEWALQSSWLELPPWPARRPSPRAWPPFSVPVQGLLHLRTRLAVLPAVSVSALGPHIFQSTLTAVSGIPPLCP